MKKAILILIQVLIFSQLIGQTKSKPGFLNHSTSINESKCKIKSLSLKNYLVDRKEYKKSSADKYTPKFSLDLLDGSGIHLFSISKMGPIPSMNVGARIKAGISISI